MTFVLLVVLVWYTTISPSYGPAPQRAAGAEPSDAEERESVRVREGAAAAAADGLGGGVHTSHALGAGESVDDLDWPEVIGDD